MKHTKLVKIGLYFGNSTKPAAYMMIPVPLGADKEEYIQDFLDDILSGALQQDTDWNYE